MFTADCYMTMEGRTDTIISALEILKEKIAGQNEANAMGNRGSKGANGESFDEMMERGLKRIQKGIDGLKERDQEEELSVQISPFFPLAMGITTTGDVNDEEIFMEIATALHEGKLVAGINWEGIRGSHSIEWTMSDGLLTIRYYDWDGEEEEIPVEMEEDDELDVEDENSFTVYYQWKNAQWEKSEDGIPSFDDPIVDYVNALGFFPSIIRTVEEAVDNLSEILAFIRDDEETAEEAFGNLNEMFRNDFIAENFTWEMEDEEIRLALKQ